MTIAGIRTTTSMAASEIQQSSVRPRRLARFQQPGHSRSRLICQPHPPLNESEDAPPYQHDSIIRTELSFDMMRSRDSHFAS